MKITGLILAGGLARRMGGNDKGLRQFQGKPMIAHVLERLEPQVDAMIINANQHHEAYATFGYPVIADVVPGFAGPLAGLHAGLRACTTPLLASAPCDTPFLPADLIAKLYAGLIEAEAQLAVAKCGGWTQPLFTLCQRELLDYLTRFLDGGGHKAYLWYAKLKIVEVPFPDPSAFTNINTPEELERLDQP
ncbi:MAG: molybdenum cofactor guanylyltransferase [Sterolibacterium sp.]|nr:molybdenum cofactor guanylyltransferase [Sterolibacterium sp.]